MDHGPEFDPAMVELPPAPFSYRAAGDFTRTGRPVSISLATISIDRPLVIMKHQVTAADYRRCVEDHACPPFAADVAIAADRPAVKVSWRDAQAYAAWLSEKSGATYRLPSDEEWAFAAGSRFRDDPLPDFGDNDPAQRWLARYDRDAARQEETDREPRPTGSFGANEKGLVDLAGNVWEWTDTCFARGTLDDTGQLAERPIVNCTIRVLEGRHRTYAPDFIRDPRTGACAVGAPPSNFGFRLVREDTRWHRLGRLVRQAARILGAA
jgi:formylglycine-generating enzyme required for sulfatase activity